MLSLFDFVIRHFINIDFNTYSPNYLHISIILKRVECKIENRANSNEKFQENVPLFFYI